MTANYREAAQRNTFPLPGRPGSAPLGPELSPVSQKWCDWKQKYEVHYMQLLLQHMQSNQSQPLAATPGRLSLFYLLTCPWPALNLFVFVVPRFLLKIQPVLFPSWGTDGSSVSFLQCERPAPVSYCKAEPALLWLSDLKSFRLSCSVFS